MRRAFAAVLVTAALVTGSACSAGADEPGSPPDTTLATNPSPAPSTATPTPSPTGDVPGGWGPSAEELTDAQRRVGEMSRKEKVGSLLMPQFAGRSATDVTGDEASTNSQTLGVRTMARAITRYHLAGAIVMSPNITNARQVKRLNAGLAAAGAKGSANADLPLILGIDQEGGVVQRVKNGATTFPHARTIGKTGRPGNAEQLAFDNGTELRAMGFTLDFAPVADVGFDSPAIGTRAYSAKPKAAAAMATAAVDGYRDAGIVPVVKHFPGHGSAGGDSHEELPAVTRSKAQLTKVDLVPFRAAIADQVPAVLNGHLDVRAVDPGTASSVSRKVVTGMLRDDLGFGGVTFTDSHLMEPISGKYGAGEAAVRSVLAGEDVVLMPADLGGAYDALLDAATSGRISEKRLDEAVTRVTALRLYAKRIGADRPSWSEVPWAKHRAHVRAVIAEAG